MTASYGVKLEKGGWFNAPIPARTSERHTWAELLENQNKELPWQNIRHTTSSTFPSSPNN